MDQLDEIQQYPSIAFRKGICHTVLYNKSNTKLSERKYTCIKNVLAACGYDQWSCRYKRVSFNITYVGGEITST